MRVHRREAIERYVDTGLPPGGEARLRVHLRKCTACRDYYDEQVRLYRALAGDVSSATPAETAHGVARAVRAMDAARTRSPFAWRPLGSLVDTVVFSPRRTIAVAAVCVFIAFGLSWMVRAYTPAATLVRGTNVSVDGKPVEEGSRIRVGRILAVPGNGIAELELARGGTLRVYPNTQVELGRKGASIELRGGRVWCLVDAGKGSFIVSTPRGEARVLGTSFVVEHRKKADTTDVRVMKGRVEVEDRQRKGKVEVSAGYQTRVTKGSPPAEPRRYDPNRDRFDWNRFFKQLWKDIKKAFRDIRKEFENLAEPDSSPNKPNK